MPPRRPLGARPLRRAARGDRRLLRRALRVASTTVDPSGLVKGWSVDRGGELLEAGGIRNYSINAGGDIRMRGAALPEPAWRTGIQHPQLLDRIAAIVEANDLALATSGDLHPGRAHRRPAQRRGRRRGSSRSRSPATTSAPPMPTRPPRSRWASRRAAWTAHAPPYEAFSHPRRRHVALDAGVPASPRPGEISRRAAAAGERGCSERPARAARRTSRASANCSAIITRPAYCWSASGVSPNSRVRAGAA